MGCRTEMPHLQSLWSEVRKTRGEDVVFLCVNVRDEAQVITDYWRKSGFDMRAVRTGGEDAGKAFGVVGYPTT